MTTTASKRTLPMWDNNAGDVLYAYENVDGFINVLIREAPRGRRTTAPKASIALRPDVAASLGRHLVAASEQALDNGSSEHR